MPLGLGSCSYGAPIASCCRLTCARAAQDLEKTLEPIFFFFKQRRAAGEPFGDFCARVGFDAIRDYTKV